MSSFPVRSGQIPSGANANFNFGNFEEYSEVTSILEIFEEYSEATSILEIFEEYSEVCPHTSFLVFWSVPNHHTLT